MSTPQRIRIRTMPRESGLLRPRGQDTIAEIVNEDGTTTKLPDVLNAHWWVDSRQGYCRALLLVSCELDAEAETADRILEANSGSLAQTAAAFAVSRHSEAEAMMKNYTLDQTILEMQREIATLRADLDVARRALDGMNGSE